MRPPSSNVSADVTPCHGLGFAVAAASSPACWLHADS